jgi:hypothetical protein
VGIALGVGLGIVAFVVTAGLFLSSDPSLEGLGNLPLFYAAAFVAGVVEAIPFRRWPAFSASSLISYEVLTLLGAGVYSSRAFGAVLFAPIGFALAYAALRSRPFRMSR